MRTLALTLATLLALVAVPATLAGQAPTHYLGSRAPDKPVDHSVYIPPAEPPRQGGNTIEEAILITIPGTYTGTTVGYTNDYDEICPYTGSTAPDVVYQLAIENTVTVDIDLCYSSFDTKLYVYDVHLNLIGCNDDAHFGPPCFTYSSKLTGVTLLAGMLYYVVIDGYGAAAGDYQLDITITPETPALPCPPHSDLENEPPLVDGYQDAHNGGCNSPEFGHPFQTWEPSAWTFCGTSGWYINSNGVQSRDTDWFLLYIHDNGVLEISGVAEYPTVMFELAPQDCGSVGVVQSVTIGPNQEGTLTIYGPPHSPVWFWVGPTTFSGPVNEYSYVLHKNSGGCFPGGSVTINPQPGAINAPWTLVPPWGSVIHGTGYGVVDAEEGTYTLTWGDVPGWVTPDPATEVAYLSGYDSSHHFTATYLPELPYLNDFDHGEANYFTVVSGTWQVVDGWYRCQNFLSGVRHLTTVGHQYWTDYRTTVDVMAEGALVREILIRYQSPDDHYRFAVEPHPAGIARFWKTVGGQSTLLHEHPTGAVDGDEPLQLAITADGSTFQAFLDGEFLFAVDDPVDPLLAGGVGLSAYADPVVGWQIASFDNLAIEPLDAVSVASLPAVTTLSLAAVPNPFNPATVVRFELPRAGDVTIAVHDLRGRLVRTLHQGGAEAGRHEVTWDGRDGVGGAAASGVYLVRLVTADGEAQAVKITLAK